MPKVGPGGYQKRRVLEYKVIWGHLVNRLKLNRSLSRSEADENSSSGPQTYEPYGDGDCHSGYMACWN